MTAQIKRGVSLYSFQEEYLLGKLDLEGCIATATSFGAHGIEILGEQMFPGFPHPTPERLETWRDALSRHNAIAVCHDMFLDTKRYSHRVLTLEESVDSVLRDIRFAHLMGCRKMRMIIITPPEVMEMSVRYAERYDVQLLLEIHSPWHFEHEWVQRHLEVMQRIGSPYLGLLPDLGIFVKRFPRIIRERYVRDGADPKLAQMITDVYDAGGDVTSLPDEVTRLGGGAKDIALAGMVSHYLNLDPRVMLGYMPYIRHIHAKFYEMINEETEYSISYPEVISVLKDGEFDGYMCSEYEGNRHVQDAFAVDSIEQVRLHQKMMKHFIDEPAKPSRADEMKKAPQHV